jgi:hypothetical protein
MKTCVLVLSLTLALAAVFSISPKKNVVIGCLICVKVAEETCVFWLPRFSQNTVTHNNNLHDHGCCVPHIESLLANDSMTTTTIKLLHEPQLGE